MVENHITKRIERNNKDYADRVISVEIKRIWMSVVAAHRSELGDISIMSSQLNSSINDGYT